MDNAAIKSDVPDSDTQEQKRDEENNTGEEVDDAELCGIGSCHPAGLQRFARLIFFTLTLAFSGLSTIMQGPMVVSQVISIERQFNLNSAQMGALMAANDVGFILLVLLVSHFARDSHTPRILGVALLIYGACAACIAALNFVHPHSLEGASSNTTAGDDDNIQYLCSLDDDRTGNHTDDCNMGDDGGGTSVGAHAIVMVMGVFLALQGATKATRGSLGTAYIDNNVPKKSKTGLYIGINMTVVLFGPPLGFALGGIISRIPVDLSETTLQPEDPRWISAWWVGFLVSAALTMVFSVPMMCFPRRMRGARSKAKMYEQQDEENGEKNEVKDTAIEKSPEKEDSTPSDTDTTPPASLEANGKAGETQDGGEKEPIDHAQLTTVDKEGPRTTFLVMLKDMPLSMLRLLRNPVFVLILVSLSVYIFAVVGFSSFLIKYAQYQFGLPTWLSSYVFGFSNLIFSGLGTFTGGVVVSRFNLTRRGCLRWVIATGSASTLLSAVTITLGCDNQPMVGLNRQGVVYDDGLTTCSCDSSQFLPVCDGNQTFVSPCHAACTHSVNATHFTNCGLAAAKEVTVGACSTGCHLMIPFVVVQVMANAFGSTTVTPIYFTLLRSVSEQDKTLGLGLVSFTIALIGFIPGPIAYGAAIDGACLIWSKTCGEQGACAFYDVTKLRYAFNGLETGVKALTMVLFSLSLACLTWQLRTGRTKDEKPDQKSDEVEGEDGFGQRKGSFAMVGF